MACALLDLKRPALGWICDACGGTNNRHRPACFDCGHERCDGYKREPIDDELQAAWQAAADIRAQDPEDRPDGKAYLAALEVYRASTLLMLETAK